MDLQKARGNKTHFIDKQADINWLSHSPRIEIIEKDSQEGVIIICLMGT